MSRIADYLIEREETLGTLYLAGWISIDDYDDLIDEIMILYGYS